MTRFTRTKEMLWHLKLYPRLRASLRRSGRATRLRRSLAMHNGALFAGLVLRVKRCGVRPR